MPRDLLHPATQASALQGKERRGGISQIKQGMLGFSLSRLNDQVANRTSDIEAGRMMIRIMGTSMFPLFRHGSLAMAEFCSFDDLRRGDLAVFKGEDGGFVCHRLFKKHRQQGECLLKTKGDASLFFDGLVRKESIVGRVAIVHIGSFSVKVNNLPCRLLGLGLGCIVPFIRSPFFMLRYLWRSIWRTA